MQVYLHHMFIIACVKISSNSDFDSLDCIRVSVQNYRITASYTISTIMTCTVITSSIISTAIIIIRLHIKDGDKQD